MQAIPNVGGVIYADTRATLRHHRAREVVLVDRVVFGRHGPVQEWHDVAKDLRRVGVAQDDGGAVDSKEVEFVLWEMLVNAGAKRWYGIVGDALNPVIDALRRNGNVDFVHVRNEEYSVFAAVAEAYFTGEPVAVCGMVGPGVVHLFNGLMDARKERAPVIAI